jgi:hypothetical protein
MEPSDPSVGFCLLFFQNDIQMNDDRISSLIRFGNDGKRSGPTFKKIINMRERPSLAVSSQACFDIDSIILCSRLNVLNMPISTTAPIDAKTHV